MEDPKRIVAIHCNSGKGRAGLTCVCLMVYLGLFDNLQDSAKYFASRRFTDEKGLSQPCQVRTGYYFEDYLLH